MKKTHAAALALVGWYLMMPPRDPLTALPDHSAPMTRWLQLEAFDTAKECQAAKFAYHERLAKKDQARADYELLSDCVESNDLRLNH